MHTYELVDVFFNCACLVVILPRVRVFLVVKTYIPFPLQVQIRAHTQIGRTVQPVVEELLHGVHAVVLPVLLRPQLGLLVDVMHTVVVQFHAVVLVVQVFGLQFVLNDVFEFFDLFLDQFEHCLLVFRGAFTHLLFYCFSCFKSVPVCDIVRFVIIRGFVVKYSNELLISEYGRIFCQLDPIVVMGFKLFDFGWPQPILDVAAKFISFSQQHVVLIDDIHCIFKTYSWFLSII